MLRLSLGGLIAAVLASVALHAEQGAAAVAGTPNVVVIMTDDQDSSELRLMAQTKKLLAGHGVSFKRYYDSDPLCCPSRTTYLTGQYAHNHRVRSNTGPSGGYQQFKATGDIDNTLNIWLQGAGYTTGFVGKYLNGYGRGGPTQKKEIPPGWDQWFAAPGSSEIKVYDYTLNQNGRLRRYGHKPRDYQTDVYGKLATKFIQHQDGTKPFFLSLAPLAPHDDTTANEAASGGVHGPPPAPRHQGRFRHLAFPHKRSFNEKDVTDKPRYIRKRPRYNAHQVANFVASYRRRAASLLAVDDLVGDVVSALRAKGQLDNTYIFFTSDNGYLLGEHRIETKSYPYEESVRVPLVVRGPGIPAGEGRSQLTANVDLAPTILDIAGASGQATRPLDGLSLLPTAVAGLDPTQPGSTPRAGILIESFSLAHYQGVESGDWTYVQYSSGEKELYNLGDDPLQLSNLASKPSTSIRRHDMAHLLAQLADCAGETCSQGP
ncbi:MAG: N-acetylglucosamine-6-sulfatase [Solirubrobacterales bacterium]|jgi:arylsulfatase A-like enzyme|nr:N-acetylglucosamine-6-sulfatase [Solirubrobacterales bacterium]